MNGTAMPEILTRRKTEQQRRSDPLGRLEQFYHAAKKGEWSIKDLPWENADPVPRVESERWRIVWASVVAQQLQADIIAVEAASNLLVDVTEFEARMYYSTMVSDEARHCEAWTKLAHMLDPVEAHNPYLAEMGDIFREEKGLENRVLAFQVCFEGAAIYAFKEISAAAHQTILGDMATRLIRDDSIHHNSGVAYAAYLLSKVSESQKKDLHKTLKRYAPLYVESTLWKPKARQWVARFTAQRDRELLHRNQVLINKAVLGLGLGPVFDI
ncbi:MAG TPA: hypothetical protein PLL64_09325 [Rhodothermales bacterium]|nr:hypothetical protein [Cytophagales bacterium]HRK74464.1 hypothetical protein [Rhodothermales bacterium]HRR08715.1 hypothetical protein [Rhodothermales bacterium]